eukprot:4969057-Prymnesium_polylepis.1
MHVDRPHVVREHRAAHAPVECGLIRIPLRGYVDPACDDGGLRRKPPCRASSKGRRAAHVTVAAGVRQLRSLTVHHIVAAVDLLRVGAAHSPLMAHPTRAEHPVRLAVLCGRTAAVG